MKISNNLGKTFIFLTILPLFLLIVFGYFRGADNSRIGSNFGNLISTILLLISIAGCLFVAVANSKSDHKKSIWYTLPITLGIALLIIFYFGFSLSHFGF